MTSPHAYTHVRAHVRAQVMNMAEVSIDRRLRGRCAESAEFAAWHAAKFGAAPTDELRCDVESIAAERAVLGRFKLLYPAADSFKYRLPVT